MTSGSSPYRLIKALPDVQNRVTHGGQIEPRPFLDEVAPDKLLVDERYQRSLSERSSRMIRDIVRDWDWKKFKPPVVVEIANGDMSAGLVVIDGQHTAIAAVTRGIERIPVLIVEASSVQEQAKAFLGHNTMRVSVTKTQIFHAAIAAGDEDAVTARNVCSRAGVKILISQPGREFEPRETMAVNAIVNLAKKHGALPARQILQAIAEAEVAPIKALHIRAAELLMRDKELRRRPDDLSGVDGNDREVSPRRRDRGAADRSHGQSAALQGACPALEQMTRSAKRPPSSSRLE
jgi:hypothetical protein